MIHDLEILNGTLELNFNEYTYFYTVTVSDEVSSLEFSYKLADDTYVEVKNNELTEEENTVTLEVYNVNDSVTYTFLVYKNKTEAVSGIDNYMKSLESENIDTFNLPKVQILAISIFLLIILIYSLLFHRKTKKAK